MSLYEKCIVSFYYKDVLKIKYVSTTAKNTKELYNDLSERNYLLIKVKK